MPKQNENENCLIDEQYGNAFNLIVQKGCRNCTFTYVQISNQVNANFKDN